MIHKRDSYRIVGGPSPLELVRNGIPGNNLHITFTVQNGAADLKSFVVSAVHKLVRWPDSKMIQFEGSYVQPDKPTKVATGFYHFEEATGVIILESLDESIDLNTAVDIACSRDFLNDLTGSATLVRFLRNNPGDLHRFLDAVSNRLPERIRLDRLKVVVVQILRAKDEYSK